MAVVGKSVRSGTREWLFQRIANVAIVLYALVFIVLVLTLENVSFNAWAGLFDTLWFKIYSSLTLLIVALNSVLAGWQIGADYVKVTPINRIYMAVVIGGTLIYLVAGNWILWL